MLVTLAGFALSRAVSSLTNKDVRGRLLPKGERGRVTGLATSISGVAAIAVGLGVRLLGEGNGTALLAGLLAGAAVLWLPAAGLYARVVEAPTEPPPASETGPGRAAQAFTLLRTHPDFRHFVLARTLLLVSALSPPFVVGLTADRTGGGAAAAGLFVVASGVASSTWPPAIPAPIRSPWPTP